MVSRGQNVERFIRRPDRETSRNFHAWREQRDATCKSGLLKRTIGAIIHQMNDLPRSLPQDIPENLEVAKWLFAVADATKEQHCKDISRFLFDTALKTYIGPAYAGLRDRAQVAIEDLQSEE